MTGSQILVAGLRKATSIDSLDLSTSAGARNALSTLDKVQARISLEQGSIGAFQSRLEVVSRTLQTAREALAAASSRITDVDVASESAELARTAIVVQAGAAIAAQANRAPQVALQLLRG